MAELKLALEMELVSLKGLQMGNRSTSKYLVTDTLAQIKLTIFL